ncbi:MAG: hypothetical protein NTY19_03000 [Planctomycetota bacterium]|nr:hypothetical protein [Planctomycetota bacterium]
MKLKAAIAGKLKKPSGRERWEHFRVSAGFAHSSELISDTLRLAMIPLGEPLINLPADGQTDLKLATGDIIQRALDRLDQNVRTAITEIASCRGDVAMSPRVLFVAYAMTVWGALLTKTDELRARASTQSG